MSPYPLSIPLSPFSFTNNYTYYSQYEDSEDQTVANIQRNAKRYLHLFADAVDALLPASTTDVTSEDDVIDIMIAQRKQKDAEDRAKGILAEGEEMKFPAALTRRL